MKVLLHCENFSKHKGSHKFFALSTIRICCKRLQSYDGTFLLDLNFCCFQDLFHSGAIQSATDFQVYEDVGGLSGLDFAYTDATAVYHTKVYF